MKKRVFQILGSGLTYGALIGMFLFLVNTPANATLFETLKLLFVAVICALVSGLFLSLVIYFFDMLRFKRFASFRQELSEKDPILLEDNVSRLLDGKQVAGRLFLTSSVLVFKPYGRTEDRSILTQDVSSVEITDPRRCRITVNTASMEAETFAVPDPLLWFNTLGDLKG